jgi:hypothetical protein
MKKGEKMRLVGSKFHVGPTQTRYGRIGEKKVFVIFNFGEIQQIYHSKKKASI